MTTNEINKIYGELQEIKIEMEKFHQKNEEQDKKIDSILHAVQWVGTLGKVITGAGKIAGSIAVITALFWAFMKFIATNLKF